MDIIRSSESEIRSSAPDIPVPGLLLPSLLIPNGPDGPDGPSPPAKGSEYSFIHLFIFLSHATPSSETQRLTHSSSQSLVELFLISIFRFSQLSLGFRYAGRIGRDFEL